MMTLPTVIFSGQPFYPIEGTTDVMGFHGPLFTYSIYVQKGLQAKGLGVTREYAQRKIDSVLSDKRGWTRGFVRFQRVQKGAGTFILIAEPETVDRLCYPLQTKGEVSCCNGRYVVFNAVRWKEGVPHWTGSISTYRQMLINHEMGHRIGKSHQNCPGHGKLAPVMQQQTYGLQGCLMNSWPLDSELPIEK
jgi:hypothetical protein